MREIFLQPIEKKKQFFIPLNLLASTLNQKLFMDMNLRDFDGK
jgi:hypothetical protein